MEFRVFGPVEVVAGGEPVPLGSTQQRAVLALLLINTPESLSQDRLMDELWRDHPPPSARHAVQVYVSGIRRALRAAAGDAPIRTAPSGYVLSVDPECIDGRRFERLVADAQRALDDDARQAQRLFDQALALWRGAPFEEFGEFEFARREAGRLEELRAGAVEGLVEARLEGGEHREVIGQITDLVAANPLRERPRQLLMLALYRSGRHAEALAAYRDACQALDEIGLQPSPELRELEEAILRHDQALRLPAPKRDAPEARLSALVRAPAPASARELKAVLDAERAGHPFLLYRDGEAELQVHTLDDCAAWLTLGRSQEADVVLSGDDRVSAVHAELHRAAGLWTIADDGLSRNGTFLNGSRLTGRQRLRDGDTLVMGRTVVLYRIGGSAPIEVTELD